MAGAPWSLTNRPAAASPASASLAAPASASGQNQQTRLRALQCSLAGTAAGTDQVVVRDGATGAGTIIAQWDLAVPANGAASLALSDLDLRASPGNSLTIEFVSGVASDRECVNAQGDFVPQGYPYGAP